MQLDDALARRVHERWCHLAMAGAEDSHPERLPSSEFARSPAAMRVGALAERDGLFLYHFEHRAMLELPSAWVHGPADDIPIWENGVLPERKYQSFRHDLGVGSFHPHHRAKWSSHELCHALVGFAWRPDASPFFHATAGRLAELLPVVLWYCFDEAFLRRCPAHQGDGALYREHCAACERIASPAVDDAHALDWIRRGIRWLDRELAAVHRARHRGQWRPYREGPINLCSDGRAYATSHGARLADPRLEHWMEEAWAGSASYCRSLDELEHRVLSVAGALFGETELPALFPSAEAGRSRLILQDLSSRLLMVEAQAPDDVGPDVAVLRHKLQAPIATTTNLETTGHLVAEVFEAYEALYDRPADLPDPDLVFAVGYPIPNVPAPSLQILEGLQSVQPLTLDLLDEGVDDAVMAFVSHDLYAPQRVPLAQRFSTFVDSHPAFEPRMADLARYEAQLSAVPTAPPAAYRGHGTGLQLSPGTTLQTYQSAVITLAERVEAGSIVVAYTEEGQPALASLTERPVPPLQPMALMMGRSQSGALTLLELDISTAARIQREPDSLDASTLTTLLDLELLEPVFLHES